mgnify:CR=1 FL=1
MAHPKRKISKTRRDKRRTHYKASVPQIATCPTTGEPHLYHRAHWHEGFVIIFWIAQKPFTLRK